VCGSGTGCPDEMSPPPSTSAAVYSIYYWLFCTALVATSHCDFYYFLRFINTLTYLLTWCTNSFTNYGRQEKKEKVKTKQTVQVITKMCVLKFTGVIRRPFVKWFALYAVGQLSVLSVCNVGVLWPNGWIDQDVAWYGGRPRPVPHCARWGCSSSPRKAGTAAPLFGPICALTVAHLSNSAELLYSIQTTVITERPYTVKTRGRISYL